MKQLIVMISMMILGIAIGGFVMGFQGVAENISEAAAGQITLANITEPVSLAE